MTSCSFCVVVLMCALTTPQQCCQYQLLFHFFRELIAFLTSPLLIGLVLYLLDLRNFISSYLYWVRRWCGLLRISSKCSFHLASLLESSVMVLPPLSLLPMLLWGPSLQIVFVIPYRVFMFPISAA